MAYSNIAGKIIKGAYGKFRSTAIVAVKSGDLVARDITSHGWILADEALGFPAEAVAIEDIAASKKGWFAAIVVIETPASIGSKGVPSAQALAASTDIAAELWLSTAGMASSSAGGTTQQVVGVVLDTDSALLRPQ